MDDVKKQQVQDKLIMKVLGKIREQQFKSLNMEDMARLMGISRATLYKYFANKEEIFFKFTDGLIAYIEQVDFDVTDVEKIAENFQRIFEQSTSLALLVPESFIAQLEEMYPDMHANLTRAIHRRNERVLSFYQLGTEQGLFRRVNPHLLVLQNQLFESIFDVKFLMANQLTIKQALWDFYALQKEQLFEVRAVEQVNDAQMAPKIQYLAEKVTKILY